MRFTHALWEPAWMGQSQFGMVISMICVYAGAVWLQQSYGLDA